MKKIVKSLAILSVVAISLVMFSKAAMAINGNSKATVVGTVSVAQDGTQRLNFGSFYATVADKTVIIAATETGTRTGTADLLLSDPGSSGKFVVTGTGNNVVNITLGRGEPATLTDGNGHSLNIVTLYPTNGDPESFTGNVTLNNGTGMFYVGGTINTGLGVDIAQPGVYTGVYTVAVAY